MQSRTMSFIEQLLNIGSGFILAMLVWHYVVAPLYDIPVTVSQNIGITSIFTFVSIIRGYCWRRFFTRIIHWDRWLTR